MASTEGQVHKLVDDLSRGLLDSDWRVAYQAHNALFKVGAPAIPIVESHLLYTDWSHPRYHSASRYVAGMVSLVRDIDEDRADVLTKTLIDNGCHDAIKGVLRSLARFSTKGCERFRIEGIEVLTEKGIAAGAHLQSLLCRWLANVPEPDKAGIVRILVVEDKNVHDAQGTYTPHLAMIVLGWPKDMSRIPIVGRIFGLFMEKVFYHEVGHHMHRHTFGKDTTQEYEANRYAYSIMRRTHRVLWWLSMLVRPRRMPNQAL
ncbi:MAG TPA: hypothetical protein VI078_01070 [bacterium]